MRYKKMKGSFYIAQYPLCWTAQNALYFLPSQTDLSIPTPTRLLREAFSPNCAVYLVVVGGLDPGDDHVTSGTLEHGGRENVVLRSGGT